MSNFSGYFKDKDNNSIYPIEIKSSTKQRCIKFPDGTMIISMVYIFNIPANKAIGNIFRTSTAQSQENYIVPFIDVPNTFLTCTNINGYVANYGASRAATKDRPGTFVVMTATESDDSSDKIVNILSIGRWK